MNETSSNRRKVELWAKRPRVVRLPRIANMPAIHSRKFSSYEEFNAWKDEIIRELIRRGGAKWTR